MKNLLVLLCFLGINSAVFGQHFEGIIRYDLKFDVGDMPGAEMLNGIPMSMIMSVKDSKTRVFLDMGFMTQSVITDTEKGENIILEDMEKKAVVQNYQDINPQNTSRSIKSWNRMKESADIVGYKCFRYETDVEFDGKKLKQEIWVHEALKVKRGKYADAMESLNEFGIKGTEGLPLKMTVLVSQGGVVMKMNLTAVAVEAKNIPDSDFEIPAGYTK